MMGKVAVGMVDESAVELLAVVEDMRDEGGELELGGDKDIGGGSYGDGSMDKCSVWRTCGRGVDIMAVDGGVFGEGEKESGTL